MTAATVGVAVWFAILAVWMLARWRRWARHRMPPPPLGIVPSHRRLYDDDGPMP